VESEATQSRPPAGDDGILGWEDDPGSPDTPETPISERVPSPDTPPLPSKIHGRAPAPRTYQVGTSEFRYWAAADALRRVADFWGAVLPSGTRWHSTVGDQLEIALDEGEDFNAYYDRRGLHFFHGSVGNRIVYSGESPDVVCHEFGHAVLDAIRPQLWGVASPEPPAFHEAWGDMSGMLSALQLPSVRAGVLADTASKIDRSSRLSRLAEQLGWAIRQRRPDVVDRDCLRNAANTFFYRDPVTLPPSAPASALSSEPHSFSRVFSGAFLNVLAGMFDAQPTHDEAALQQVSLDAGRLLVLAGVGTPMTVAYYSQIAAHMIEADRTEFGGRYADALRAGFVRHGVLSLGDAAALPAEVPPPPRGMAAEEAAAPSEPERIAIAGGPFGLEEHFLVEAASEPKRFAVAGAAPDVGSVPAAPHDRAAASFVEDLFRRQHIAVDPEVSVRAVPQPVARPTHELRREGESVVLSRLLFDCGHAPLRR
jgi:hypothetical protein